MATVKMKFHEDKYVDGKMFARKDREVEVDIGSVERWLKRGGILIDDPEAVEKLEVEDAIEKSKKKPLTRK